MSQQELDDALAAQAAGRAGVDAGKAAVEKATIDLGYTRVTAPIDGLVGVTQVKAGHLVGRGESTLLTTVITDQSDSDECRDDRGGVSPAEQSPPRLRRVLCSSTIQATAATYAKDATVTFTDYPDRATAEQALTKGDVDAALAVPADLSSPGEIVVHQDLDDTTRAILSGSIIALRAGRRSRHRR